MEGQLPEKKTVSIPKDGYQSITQVREDAEKWEFELYNPVQPKAEEPKADEAAKPAEPTATVENPEPLTQ